MGQAKSKKTKSAEPKPRSPSPPALKSPSPLPEPIDSKAEASEQTSEEKAWATCPRRVCSQLIALKQQKEPFESYYMKGITTEFADDINKIRNASDFNDQSVPILVEVLKQCAGNFSEEEKQRVMGAKPR